MVSFGILWYSRTVARCHLRWGGQVHLLVMADFGPVFIILGMCLCALGLFVITMPIWATTNSSIASFVSTPLYCIDLCCTGAQLLAPQTSSAACLLPYDQIITASLSYHHSSITQYSSCLTPNHPLVF